MPRTRCRVCKKLLTYQSPTEVGKHYKENHPTKQIEKGTIKNTPQSKLYRVFCPECSDWISINGHRMSLDILFHYRDLHPSFPTNGGLVTNIMRSKIELFRTPSIGILESIKRLNNKVDEIGT